MYLPGKIRTCLTSYGLLVLILALFQSHSVFAQLRNGPPMPGFDKSAPKIGEPLPDLSIFDDKGNPVNLRELASENYKVLVLGCLT